MQDLGAFGHYCGKRAGHSFIVSAYAEEKYLSKRELSNRKVLVVEDEMMIAMLIEDMRRAYPYRGENSGPGKDIVGKLDTQTRN